MIATLWRNRSLVFELAKREFTGRYNGSFGGLAWSFAQPLFLLAVYTLAFGVILKTRWGISGSTTDYALILFAGLIVFNAFSECLIKAPTLITSNPNFVKKIVFPLELLPVIAVLSTLVHTIIAIFVWFVGYIVIKGIPPPTAILFPLIIVCLIPLLLSIGWLLSALGVILRDVNQLTGIISHTLLFLTPIFYSIDAVPPILQRVLLLNPLTFIVEQFRLVLFVGGAPNLIGLLLYFVLSTVFAWLCLTFFRRLRPTFADIV